MADRGNIHCMLRNNRSDDSTLPVFEKGLYDDR
jgi:hypothetical protein